MFFLKRKLVKFIQHIIGAPKQLSMQLDLTNRCNLKCTHCYQEKNQTTDDLKFEEWIAIIDQYDELLNTLVLDPNILLCGGEPTVYRHFHEIINYISKKWDTCRIGILTNGILINQSMLERLDPERIFFQISLEGHDNYSNDKIRGAGTFLKALNAIAQLRNNGFTVSVQTVLSKRSAEWIEKMFVMANDHDIEILNFARLISQGQFVYNSNHSDDRPLKPFELKNAYENILKYSKEYNVRTHTDKPLFNLLDNHIGGHGQWGFQGVIVDHKGKLKPSSRIDLVLGDIATEGLCNLYMNHPTMQRLRSNNIQECGQCKHRKVCSGDRNAAYAQTGDLFAKDPGCWLNVLPHEEKR